MKQTNHLRLVLLLSLVAIPAIILSLPALAAEPADYEVTLCKEPNCWSCMYAWIYDTDPAGTNVRSGPGTAYSIVTTLPSDAQVTITGSVGEWMRIEDAWIDNATGTTELHFTGWVHGSRLSFKMVGNEPAPLYAEPDTASPVLARIPTYTYVTLAGCREGWKKVRYRALEGWLGPYTPSMTETEGEGCTPTSGAYETDVPLAASCDCAVYVAEPDPKGLTVRSGPGDDKPVVKTLPRGTKVYITRSVGEWVRINTLTTDGCAGALIGWTYGHLLAARVRSFDVDYPMPEWDSSGNVLVFAEPITGSAVVTKIPRNAEVTVLGCWGRFLKVRYNGVEGWLPSHCGDPDGYCP